MKSQSLTPALLAALASLTLAACGQVPKDPWGEDYQYRSPGQFNPDSFDLWSNGADRKPGGDGTDRDIGNWTEETSSS